MSHSRQLKDNISTAQKNTEGHPCEHGDFGREFLNRMSIEEILKLAACLMGKFYL